MERRRLVPRSSSLNPPPPLEMPAGTGIARKTQSRGDEILVIESAAGLDTPFLRVGARLFARASLSPSRD